MLRLEGRSDLAMLQVDISIYDSKIFVELENVAVHGRHFAFVFTVFRIGI